MQAAKEKISNFASVAKEHLIICRAKAEEKAEMATVRTHEEKQIAKERRKAKEAKAKMEMHQAKANHAAQKLSSKHRHYNQHPVVAGGGVETYPGSHPVGVGTAAPMAGTTAPTYPLGGHATGHKHL